MIGISNVNLQQLELLVVGAAIKPMFVQNRCYAAKGWDVGVRQFCQKHNIYYQGFSLLTANPNIVQSPVVARIAAKYKLEAEQIIFRFCHQIGIIPLTGTSSAEHMAADLSIFHFQLSDEEVELMSTT